MSRIVVVAPHPDDETLGCGGTLLKHRESGDEIHWVIASAMSERAGYSSEQMEKRRNEVASVSKAFRFSGVHQLSFETTRLDVYPLGEVISEVGRVVKDVAPDTLYVPSSGDIHSDHDVVFRAVASCTKWFRYPSVKRILAYETISETDFAIGPDARAFVPNVYIDIHNFLDEKIDIMSLYASEVGEFPFPRSEKTIRALAQLRGSQSGSSAAEAFILLKEIR